MIARLPQRWVATVAATAMLLALAAPLAAETPTTTQAASQEGAAGSGAEGRLVQRDGDGNSHGDVWQWLQMLLALALVVGLIFLSRWLLRRFGLPGRAAAAMGDSPVLQVVARAPLSPRHQVQLVRCGRRLVLLGVGPNAVTALATVDDAGEIDELLAGSDKDSFRDVLKRKAAAKDAKENDAK